MTRLEYTYEDLMQIAKEALKIHSPHATDILSALKYEIEDQYDMELFVPIDGHLGYVSKKQATSAQKEMWILEHLGEAVLLETLRKDKTLASFTVYGNAGVGGTLIGSAIKSQGKNDLNDDYSSHQRNAALWGIPVDLKIASTIALYYLLMSRHERHDTKATQELMFFLDKLAPIMSSYLDMVVGGEVRHVINSQYKKIPRAVADVEAEAFASGAIKLIDRGGESVLHLVDETGYGILPNYLAGTSRSAAWTEWYNIRQKYGIIAMDWAIMQLFGVEEGGIGGALWANAGNLVRKFQKGEVSKLAFVDTAFSMEHNGGCIFNKLWSTQGVSEVLDYGFKGEYEKLPSYLTDPEHLAIYRSVCREITAVDGHRKNVGRRLDTSRRVALKFNKSTVLGIDARKELELTR